jgi:hypothetical protein
MSAQTADGPEAEEIPTEDAITRLRFRLDGLKELVRRIWSVAMHGEDERGPLDYPPWDDERRILVNIIKEQVRKSGATPSGGHGGVQGTGWSTWILGIVGALIAAGILGLTSAMFTMTGRIASLETKVDMLVAKDRK